jgi:predicted helicase
MPLSDRREPGVFAMSSAGLKSNRDAWVYGLNREQVLARVKETMAAYNEGLTQRVMPTDEKSISWSTGLRKRFSDRRPLDLDDAAIRLGAYRPFFKAFVYFDRSLNEAPSKLPLVFPAASTVNYGIYIVGQGSDRPFASVVVDCLPDLAFWGSSNGLFLARYRSEPDQNGTLPVCSESADNITDEALTRFTSAYGSITGGRGAGVGDSGV